MKSNPTRLHATSAALLRARALFADSVPARVADGHVMAMLFWKFICDASLGNHAQPMETPDRITRLVQAVMDKERFFIPPEAQFDILHQQRHDPGCAGRLDRALRAVQQANQKTLCAIFLNIDFEHKMAGKGGDGQEQERLDHLLKKMLEIFAEPALDFRPGGMAQDGGEAADFLLRHFAAKRGKTGPKAPTAPAVAELLARLAAPTDGDELCDPACGTGTLLLACAKWLQRGRHARRSYGLAGQEADGATWAAARMHLLLRGEDARRLSLGHTLRYPGLLTSDGKLQRFDVQVCALPSSASNWCEEDFRQDRFKRFGPGQPPANRGDYAIPRHMAACMKRETGRVVVLCAPDLLSSEGAGAKFRRRFLEATLVDAVINLPPKLLPGLNHGAGVLLLRMGKTDGSVLFVDADRIPRAGGVKETIGQIVDAVTARANVEGVTRLAYLPDIENQGFNLGVARYAKIWREPHRPSPEEFAHERRAIEAGYHELNRQLAPHFAFLKLAHLNLAAQSCRVGEVGIPADAGPLDACLTPKSVSKILASRHAAETVAMLRLDERGAGAAALQSYMAGLDRPEAPCEEVEPDARRRLRRVRHHALALAALWDRLIALDRRACKVLAQERWLIERKLGVGEPAARTDGPQP